MNVEVNEVATGHAPVHAEEPKVEVIYNGVKKKVEFQFSETMGVLRERAIREFGNVPAPHTLSLFTTAGVEFGPDKDNLTICEAGIVTGDMISV